MDARDWLTGNGLKTTKRSDRVEGILHQFAEDNPKFVVIFFFLFYIRAQLLYPQEESNASYVGILSFAPSRVPSICCLLSAHVMTLVSAMIDYQRLHDI